MHSTDSYFNLQLVSVSSVVAGTIILVVFLSKYGRSQVEAPARYYVKPPEAIKSAYQTRSSETLTEVRYW